MAAGEFKNIEIGANQILFDEGDVPDAAYLIREGSVEIRKGARTDNPATLTVLEKGDILGELGLFNESPRMASAITREACKLVKISKKDFLSRLNAMDPVMMKVILYMAAQISEMSAKYVRKGSASWEPISSNPEEGEA